MKLLLLLVILLAACGSPFVPLPFKPDPAPWQPLCGDALVDWQNAVCHQVDWQMPTCAALTSTDSTQNGMSVISLPDPLTYSESPPLAGPHRPDWARYGEYAFLPPQRWLYNLQHGAIVVLYHPCVPADFVEQLRAFVRDQLDPQGFFRWVMTPYPDLDTAFAILAWQHRLSGNCLDRDAAQAFVTAHYRHGPDDIALDGAYSYAWIGRNGALNSTPGAPASCSDAGTKD